MDTYLQEYSSNEAIRKYTSRTAGYGISYLLQNDYAEVYLSAIDQFLKVSAGTSLKLLEFGCGGGMNIITLLSLLERNGRSIDKAYGTDFSETLISAANVESKTVLALELRKKMHFAVARNEKLVSELASALQMPELELKNSFHVILGVNTFRYCHRLGKARECAQDVANLLTPGGICINIDMNRRFPAFRSKMRSSNGVPEAERYLPTLEEYATPFREVGLEILRKENFCWIPHSASAALTNVCRVLGPAVNVFAKPFAMRSLVVARKKS
jgi:SAM-dependent methyltransferase